jgi:hypothetical protein
VTWTSLLANKEAQKHKTSKKELDNMRALIARDLADASLAGLSADRRFATAYNAALQAANMAIACAGYRIVSKVDTTGCPWRARNWCWVKPRTSTPTILRRVDASKILSTTLSPMLRPTQKQKRSSFKQNSFTLKSKTGLRKTTPR